MCWFGKGSRLIRAVMCMFICVIFKKKINILIILKNTKKIHLQTNWSFEFTIFVRKLF